MHNDEATQRPPFADIPFPVRIRGDPLHVFYDASALARNVAHNGTINILTRRPFLFTDVRPILTLTLPLEKYGATVGAMRFLGFEVPARCIGNDLIALANERFPDDEAAARAFLSEAAAVVNQHASQFQLLDVPFEQRFAGVSTELRRIRALWPSHPSLDLTPQILTTIRTVVVLRAECRSAERGFSRAMRDRLVAQRLRLPPPAAPIQTSSLPNIAATFVAVRQQLYKHLRNQTFQAQQAAQDLEAFLHELVPGHPSVPSDELQRLLERHMPLTADRLCFVLHALEPHEVLSYALRRLLRDGRIPTEWTRASLLTLLEDDLRTAAHAVAAYTLNAYTTCALWDSLTPYVQPSHGSSFSFAKDPTECLPRIDEDAFHNNDARLLAEEQAQLLSHRTVLDVPIYRNLLTLTPFF